ncbi:MAG TPA: Hsp70 family protein, partial [Vicinamibacterales bacterium]|nr:Hsp70 family protein [Vicinamibacterales bacterium]
VGIDLGTTNCALAWLDTTEPAEQARVRLQEVPQLVSPGEVARRTLLPSFLYLPGDMDFPAGSTALPWDAQPPHVVGELARRRGAENAVRLVASAKSWLSYGGANRTAAILPWGSPPEVPHISPVDASAAYLRHLAAVFDAEIAKGKKDLSLARQDILLTVPASFDEEARELTVRAAQAAGLKHVTLLEEPQAAFYAWLDALGDNWRRRVKVGDLVLVCDVGGGTTDFTLIAVSERDGDLTLERVAVGEHILLGGDNMDLALARLLQQRLQDAGHRIDTWQLHGLWHQARSAKESLLSDASLGEVPITVLGRGSRLVGGTISTTLRADDVAQVLLEGFFPSVARDAMPARARRVGLQELGLPYAPDTAITRHLARFLSRQSDVSATSAPIRRGPSGLACPTHVLFNGGVMKAGALRARIVDVLSGWLHAEGFEALDERHVLDAPDLDHAVAQGAAYYGMARRGRGVRIRSGAPRSYYVGIESAMPAVPGMPAPLKALCVVPFGMEEGTSASIAGLEFGLLVGEPAEFRFLSSTVRKADPVGAFIEDWGDDLEELSPLEVTLPVDGNRDAAVPVTLESRVTEIGTLELWCVARDGTNRWKLELNIREREA